MTGYRAPLRDMRFVWEELITPENGFCRAGFESLSGDLVEAVLEGVARLGEEVLAPLNRTGDEDGCVYENGVVRTPPGFREAYAAYAEGGWPGLCAEPEHGGQGLPALVGHLAAEIFYGSNLAFHIYGSLSHGAYTAVLAHGSEEQRRRWLPSLVEGTFTGTMCLTEPQCGTDLGLIRTRATPRDDGCYSVTGTKIFISAGEHDLCENIVHLVLARTPDAPAGTRGISMFLVPKRLLDAEDRPGERNGVTCTGIERKMGIHGSATCTLAFDEAEGELVGELHGGMHAMFTMMNGARLAVANQGVALAEAAYQGAAAYAAQRRQGRALDGARDRDAEADPILVHPDVRRMLLTMRAHAEGARALGAWVAAELDMARQGTDEEARAAAEDFVSLLTPVVKAFFTDVGSECANLGVQVYGGHGYIRDNGMEQFVRDARIAQIYEGANGVQAMDLVGRKLPTGAGRMLRRFCHPVADWLESCQGHKELAPFVEPLAKAFGRLQRATALVARGGMRDPNEAGAAAADYLRLFALVALAYVWARTAEVALAREDHDETGFYRAKIATARFFFERLLPQTGALFATISAGAETMMQFDDEAFAAER